MSKSLNDASNNAGTDGGIFFWNSHLKIPVVWVCTQQILSAINLQIMSDACTGLCIRIPGETSLEKVKMYLKYILRRILVGLLLKLRAFPKHMFRLTCWCRLWEYFCYILCKEEWLTACFNSLMRPLYWGHYVFSVHRSVVLIITPIFTRNLWLNLRRPELIPNWSLTNMNSSPPQSEVV